MSLEQSRRSYELRNLSNDELTIEIEKILRVEIPDLEEARLKTLAEKISMEAREFKKNSRNIGSFKATKYPFMHRRWNAEIKQFENSITSVGDLTNFVIKQSLKRLEDEARDKASIDVGETDKGVWKFKR